MQGIAKIDLAVWMVLVLIFFSNISLADRTATPPALPVTIPPDSSTKENPGAPKQYSLWPPQQIKETLYKWQNDYPDFVRLTSAQDAYGLPTAGSSDDCPYDEDVPGCKNYILTVQDYVKHPEGSDTSQRLPEVFLSGELHGNERVGPTAVMEAATLLLAAADCDAKPRKTKGHSFNSEKSSDWDAALKAAKQCRKDMEAMGIDDVHRKWLARLVSTRRIVIVPTANALGYFQNKREEGQSDPNRDFPYDIQDPKDCMKTIAGRTLNELFRQHMFQLSLTFHGGMEVVGYEWGAPTWLGHLSPDDQAESVIGAAYSQYGGSFATSPVYKFGTMNDLVYYVRGGFEDWAYAGSWDPERVVPCQPTTFGGYDAEKTKYDNSTLRVFNMLVETSNQKVPQPNTLGSSKDVFDKDTDGNGHVSRNIRLSLLAIDAVQPYVAFAGVNDVTLSDDVIPLSQENGRSCDDSKSVMVAGDQQDVKLRWTVGGAFDIDSTELWFAKWDSIPVDEIDLCIQQPTKEQVEKYFTKAQVVGQDSGTGFFSAAGAVPSLSRVSDSIQKTETFGPTFQAELDVSGLSTHDKLVVLAAARVDQSWTKQPKDFAPQLPPQSHIVNARTNPSWHHESSDGRIIEGRLDWYSMPLTIIVGDYKTSVGKQAGSGRSVGTVEHSNRFGQTTGDIVAGMHPSSAGVDDTKRDGFNAQHIFLILLVPACCFLLYKQYKEYQKRSRRQLVYASDDEDWPDDDEDDDNDDEEYGVSREGYTDKEIEMR